MGVPELGDGIGQGGLFTRDFLRVGITETPDWPNISDADIDAFCDDLKKIFDPFPDASDPNESQTEDDLIWPVLSRMGWHHFLRQQNLSSKGRENVPDGLLFADEAGKASANALSEEWRRYEIGVAIVESKRWNRLLDRKDKGKKDVGVPSTQMLRYLRRVEDLTAGGGRWGILTNGRIWRLYYQGAKSVADDFLELDLAAILGIAPYADLFAPKTDEERRHWLRVFLLIFRKEAFLDTSASDSRSFHQRSLDEGRFWEETVARNLSELVFTQVFPDLASAIVDSDPKSDPALAPEYLEEVRDGALVLLYRLLFILYAEDRNLLPVSDSRYDDYGLRDKVRTDVHRRIDIKDTFSSRASNYYSHMKNLFRIIAEGDPSLGMPPYNGGLFDIEQTPILDRANLPDSVMAPVIDALSRLSVDGERRYINYRDLSVQQLGSIYERLLEFSLVAEDGKLVIQPNVFARKGSGSYYTPDELVMLIIERTVGPLVDERVQTFEGNAEKLAKDKRPKKKRLAELLPLDPAAAILDLKVCDPAMGSGHFLVSLVDYLADRVLSALAEAEDTISWIDDKTPYVSPLAERIESIRDKILKHAKKKKWALDDRQLDDRHIVRRIVLKKVVYGVDKNPMAVELAKVALWLHTFTVGAPLSFLDHHLRCGDSLYGEWVRPVTDRIGKMGGHLLINNTVNQAKASAKAMTVVEKLTDVEMDEVKQSSSAFSDVEMATGPLASFMSLMHALFWLDPKTKEEKQAIKSWLDEQFGDPIAVATGEVEIEVGEAEQGELIEEKKAEQEDIFRRTKGKIGDALADARQFRSMLEKASELIHEERFLHWQVAFPGVWSDWESAGVHGGFDAVIGNPPWDRIKLQDVEWFAARRPEIARQEKASARKKLVVALKKDNDPLSDLYDKASQRAEDGARVARKSGQYPLLSSGDINLYSLFVERALMLIKPDGMVGLLTPSGIASDKTAAPFFKSISTSGRLSSFFDFENRRPPKEHFFPAVDSRFKFAALTVGGENRKFEAADCAFFLRAAEEIGQEGKSFQLSADDFSKVNPNTGTAPIFRTARDAELTTAVYDRLPVLVNRSGGKPASLFPVKYSTMFHMTNDSNLFRTEEELKAEGFYRPKGENAWKKGKETCVPLYVGRMVHQFDHRAASVIVNPDNVHNAALSGEIAEADKADPFFLPNPQFWVPANKTEWPDDLDWLVGFRDIARATDVRTIIASVVPRAGFGNKLPLLMPSSTAKDYKLFGHLIVGNLNSMVLDFIARQKVHSTSVNWFIVEQLPLVPPGVYEKTKFGKESAADVVRRNVLRLTYTATDMEPFARDMGYTGAPFAWDEEKRLHDRCRLDALYFHLYGITDPDDVSYVFSTFPIIERQDEEKYGRYLSRDLTLAYMNALAAGDTDVEVDP